MTARVTKGTRKAVVGALVLNPVVLACLGVLVVNDHWAKARFPGITTGKLSDFAGLVVLPVVLFVAWQIGARLAKRRGPGVRAAATVCAGSAVGFVLVKTSPWFNEAYRMAVAAIRWPFQWLTATLGDREPPGLAPIDVVRDPTDIIALLAVPVAYLILTRSVEPAGSHGVLIDDARKGRPESVPRQYDHRDFTRERK